MNIGFLASHSGSNMQAIIDACHAGSLPAVPAVVISNNSTSGALERAARERIPHFHISARHYPDSRDLDEAIVKVLTDHFVDIVVLAGYMKKIGPKTLAHFRGRILNIHPALLPKYGGRGLYGMNVHQTVLSAGDRHSGVTIHLVDGGYDTGPIIAQARVPVDPLDTPETLAARVLRQEHTLFPETLKKIANGDIILPANDKKERGYLYKPPVGLSKSKSGSLSGSKWKRTDRSIWNLTV